MNVSSIHKVGWKSAWKRCMLLCMLPYHAHSFKLKHFRCNPWLNIVFLCYLYRLYRSIFRDNYGNCEGDNVMPSLQQIADQINSDTGSTSMVVNVTTDNQVIVAICTPLMQRVHTLHKHSGELCFMDASGNMDRDDCKVFLILTHSCVGGLPIGVLITTSETESTITAALELYRTILPSDCFGGRGQAGPKVFMTDDCLAERRALNKVFPMATLVLCVFHVLQATWRWLWNTSNGIPKQDRPKYLQHIKRMMYASTDAEVQSLFDESMSDTTLKE